MATTRLTPAAQTAPAVLNVQANLSGPHWNSRYPGINDLSELAEPFRTSVINFIQAMQTAGISVPMNRVAIYRPPQRSYLMHYSKRIIMGWGEYPQLAPADVPAFQPQGRDESVDINWVHTDAEGNADIEESKKAAQQMVNGYGIQRNPVAPPYQSRHNLRPSNAIDIPLSNGNIPRDCKIKDASGNDASISEVSDLYPVGRTFGVMKLVSDPPHWSNDGH